MQDNLLRRSTGYNFQSLNCSSKLPYGESDEKIAPIHSSVHQLASIHACTSHFQYSANCLGHLKDIQRTCFIASQTEALRELRQDKALFFHSPE